VTLAETLNYARAARQLFTAQPTISAHILSLEDAFGTKLFNRNRRGVSLTPAGARLVVTARQLLQSVEAMKKDMKEASLSLSLRVCCSQVARYRIMPNLMRGMSQLCPCIPIEFVTLVPEKRMDALLSGLVDALVMVPASSHPNTVFHPMGRDRLMALVPDQPPFSFMQSISIYEFARERLLTVNEEECAHCTHSILAVLKSFGLEPAGLVEGPVDHYAQMAVVAGASAVALTSETTSGLHFPGVRRIPFKEDINGIELGILVRREELSESLQSMLNLLLEHQHVASASSLQLA
jgi:DNA-binding transcriptional LysR family regulator